MKPLSAVLIVCAAAILWAALTLAAPFLGPQTFNGPTYTVPPGVLSVAVEDDFTITEFEIPCDNYPNTPTRLPCYIEHHYIHTDNEGAQTWKLKKWTLTATPVPTPTPKPPCPGKILPNGKCKK